MKKCYFELNNWCCGENYPDAEPFLTWLSRDSRIIFFNKDWVKKNGLVVGMDIIDMSFNFCVTATEEWVQNNCPELLTKYKDFLRYPEEGEELPIGDFSSPFLSSDKYEPNLYFTIYDSEKKEYRVEEAPDGLYDENDDDDEEKEDE